jgi:hypothetical protein
MLIVGLSESRPLQQCLVLLTEKRRRFPLAVVWQVVSIAAEVDLIVAAAAAAAAVVVVVVAVAVAVAGAADSSSPLSI